MEANNELVEFIHVEIKNIRSRPGHVIRMWYSNSICIRVIKFIDNSHIFSSTTSTVKKNYLHFGIVFDLLV